MVNTLLGELLTEVPERQILPPREPQLLGGHDYQYCDKAVGPDGDSNFIRIHGTNVE